jgi:peptide-methionine (R)-S-oxide reductase
MEESAEGTGQFPVQKTEAEWRAMLTPLQYQITRQKKTERPFTGEYYNTKTPGTYQCVCCDRDLFVSDAKFDSGCGWPSFFQAVDEKSIVTQPDYELGYRREEIMCSNCGAHLGHVFEDGPPPTGLRFCVNSASVRLVEAGTKKADTKQ